MFYSIAISCVYGVQEVGEEELHHYALLVEVEWETEVEPIHSQDRCPRHVGRNWGPNRPNRRTAEED